LHSGDCCCSQKACRQNPGSQGIKGILKSYYIADEESLFNIAWDVALETGCSGFDSYFIALAKREDAMLLTDDSGMHHHADEVGINSILIRSNDLNTLKGKLE
jgi:predicted nucleic acid-binding protein